MEKQTLRLLVQGQFCLNRWISCKLHTEDMNNFYQVQVNGFILQKSYFQDVKALNGSCMYPSLCWNGRRLNSRFLFVVDELDRAIAVAARDPVRFSINEVELEKRKRWTGSTRNQMEALRKAVQTSMEKSPGKNHLATSANGMRRELLRLPNDHTGAKPNHAMDPENDDFIQSESDRQVLLMKEQDQELDELSASVERLGGVGLTIHEELMGQERILNELDQDMDKTSNRLEFVQKKVALVMKKAGAKGQIMMIVFLLILFIVLVLLVFYT